MSIHSDLERAEELRRELIALLALPRDEQPRMTYEQFLDWLDEDTLAEWEDGKVEMTSPASLRHQEIANFLVEVLSGFVRTYDLGRVLDGPFQMKLSASGREPDVLFVATAHLDRLQPTYLDGPADIVIEIISPESEGRDRGKKYYEYQDNGVAEYWLIDPQREVAEFYRLDEHGHYAVVTPDAQGIYQSRALPRFWLRVAWLWQNPLPNPIRALLDIAGKDYAQMLRDELNRSGL